MYDTKPGDVAATLNDMQLRALERCRFNQVEAAERLKTWIAQDRRFDGFSPDALATRIAECRSNGANLNLDDPGLRKGGRSANGWKQPPGRG